MAIYVLGAGEHARVVTEAIELLGYLVKYVVPQPQRQGDVAQTTFLTSPPPDCEGVVCGIGSVGDSTIRRRVLGAFQGYDESFFNIFHPESLLSRKVIWGRGIFTARGAIVNPHARIENHVILNTGSIVDHDAHLEVGTHIAPGAVLSGNVHCGPFCHIGTNATVVQGVTLAGGIVIGAGSVVLKSILEPNTVWVGNPARKIRTLTEGVR